ncbi:MAG TPA: hypothetical protein DCE42_04600 [Myxococcales bacterium]|nr:hypothetical protein [Myxococcales bacterium]|tara:strand:- start:5102 stop:5842 length:741 start_codon:yes stop_codon:yes gene_type:complete
MSRTNTITYFTVQPWDDFPYWMVDGHNVEALFDYISAGQSTDPFGSTSFAYDQYINPPSSDIPSPLIEDILYDLENGHIHIYNAIQQLAPHEMLLRYFAAECVQYECETFREPGQTIPQTCWRAIECAKQYALHQVSHEELVSHRRKAAYALHQQKVHWQKRFEHMLSWREADHIAWEVVRWTGIHVDEPWANARKKTYPWATSKLIELCEAYIDYKHHREKTFPPTQNAYPTKETRDSKKTSSPK